MPPVDRISAPRIALSYGVLLALFTTLIIDGFPAGAAVLREFGARITNFLLLGILISLLLARFQTFTTHRFSQKEILFILLIVVGVPAINLPVTFLQNDVPAAGPWSDWVRQYAMFIWALISYWVWSASIRDVPPKTLAYLITLGSIVPLAFFYADMSGSSAVHAVLDAVRVKRDERPSGMATEPSLYAAWSAFAWPVILFAAITAKSVKMRVLSGIVWVALCASAYLSNARTIAVIAVMQIVYFGYWVSRNSRGLNRLRALAILALCGLAVLAAFAQSLTTLTNSDVGSNISRIGSTVTSIRVAAAHPIFGIGIGQLRYFFAAYAPDFALASDEILLHATDLGEYRASSFNLFVRLVCELGIFIGLFCSFLVLRPILAAIRLPKADSFVMFATLAALGGVGFWLSADQFGYQPAILSLAILSKALSMRGSPLDGRQTKSYA